MENRTGIFFCYSFGCRICDSIRTLKNSFAYDKYGITKLYKERSVSDTSCNSHYPHNSIHFIF